MSEELYKVRVQGTVSFEVDETIDVWEEDQESAMDQAFDYINGNDQEWDDSQVDYDVEVVEE